MRSWWRHAWGVLAVLLVILAPGAGCGEDSYDPSALGAYETDDDGHDTHPFDSDSDDAEAGEPGPDLPLARGGIEIDRVQANQGVGVLLGAGGTVVEPADRAAPIIKDRITLVRAFWALPEHWEPREIEGRLVITRPDGTEDVFSHTKWVEQEATEGDLGRSFFWGLTADQTRPGLEFRVELRETSHDVGRLSDPSPRVRLPVGGDSAPLDVRPEPHVMKVVVVPFHYDDGAGCVTTPDTSEDTMQRFQDAIYMQNPLERVDFEVHAPIPWDTPLSSFAPLNLHLAGLRFDEGAPPETYYYGLVDVCADALEGAGGMAIGIPDQPVDQASAALRVASGLSRTPGWSAETFVHEIGHGQGRHHVACNGEEGGPNPQYPYEGGDLGEWGFGVVDFGLRNPTSHKDYMTYCHPAWVGTWGWNEVHPVIEGLSEWDAPAARRGAAPVLDDLVAVEDPYRGSLLLGMIEPDGQEHWITVPGALPESSSPDSLSLELVASGEPIARVSARVQPIPDLPGGRLIMAPLPEDWSAVTEVVRFEAGARITMARQSIQEHHRRRTIGR